MGITPDRAARSKDAIEAQVLTLSVTARRLLQCLSLLGGRAAVDLVDDCVEASIEHRLAAISEVSRSGLVTETTEHSLHLSELAGSASLALLSFSEKQVLARHISSILARRCATLYEPELAVQAIELALLVEGNLHFLETLLVLARPMIDSGDAHIALRYLELAQSSAAVPGKAEQILRLLVEAAGRTANWQAVIRSSTALQRLASPNRDADYVTEELARLEACIREDVAIEPEYVSTRALTILRDSETPTENRFTAARIVIGSASELFEADLAITAYDILSSLSTPFQALSQMVAEPIMQYHTIFGDLNEAVSMAMAVAAPNSQTESGQVSLRFVANAAYVLRVAGLREKAEAMLLSLWDSAELRRDSGRQAYVAWQLSLLASDAEDITRTVFWAERLEHVLLSSGVTSPQFWHLCHKKRVELLVTGTIADAETLVARVREESARPNRATAYSLALVLRSSTFGEMSEPDRIEMIVFASRLLSRVGRYVGQDLLAESVLCGLTSIGRASEARALAARYLSHQRRERGRPSRLLRSMAEGDATQD
jgi:hypothetical protein